MTPTRSVRPSSYGAFLLAVSKAAGDLALAEASIQAEVLRARNAGTAPAATEGILKRLSAEKYWIRDLAEVKLTSKGLRYLKEHGLLDE